MNINVQALFPIIEIDINSNKAILNEKAKEEFKDNLSEIVETIKSLKLSKKIEFAYIGKRFYAINVIKGVKFIYLCFTEVEENGLIDIKSNSSNVGVSVYSKDVLKEFLEKFLALKRRYGGFHIKFLYLKVDFVINVKRDLQKEFIENILKYTVAVTRSSDVVGQLDEKAFGIILTNASSEGANIVADKITRYISEINVNHDRRIVDIQAVLAHELLILKHSDFDELFEILNKNAEFITVGRKLKELVR